MVVESENGSELNSSVDLLRMGESDPNTSMSSTKIQATFKSTALHQRDNQQDEVLSKIEDPHIQEEKKVEVANPKSRKVSQKEFASTDEKFSMQAKIIKTMQESTDRIAFIEYNKLVEEEAPIHVPQDEEEECSQHVGLRTTMIQANESGAIYEEQSIYVTSHTRHLENQS